MIENMKVITKRKGVGDPIEDARILQRTLNQVRGNALVPKGVYRFKTFEEADQWMIKMIARTHVLRRSRTL